MNGSSFKDIEKLEADLWSAADKPIFKQLVTLRALNDKLRAARDLLLPRLRSGEVLV